MGIFVGSLLAVFMAAVADNPQNPRASSVKNDIKSDTKILSRTANMGALARRAIGETRVRAGAVPRAAARTRDVANAARVATDSSLTDSARKSMARSGMPQVTNPRAGGRNVTDSVAGMSRAATTARATAVFNDLNKIGSGYAACRESYATCMDQMCANANDTYRRCFCSDRFTKFRGIEESLDEAMIMLQQFQDNNLEAVDKTAAEVNAMYSASIGEAAIKRDTSASAKLLDNITKLLSGGGTGTTAANSGNSIGILDLDFTVDFDNVWTADDFSLFDTGGQDLSLLEGAALFNSAQRQCTRVTQDMCENNAVFTMARSSYNILVTQDCNTYEKALNKKKETVAQAVRTAEKYLREARLEEYRAHNSMDVNECLGKVRTAMLADTACGENYKRCLDPTGVYITAATGEPIYSSRLFELEKMIDLSGELGGDVLQQNPDFNRKLDEYRENKYVDPQLDTCRSIADIVWNEFKRTAIIEIAQAQSSKIEEVRASCVDVIAECYDAASQSIVNFGSKKTATTAGALGRYTARDRCRDEVVACAALYGGGHVCKFDDLGRFSGTNDEAKQCGLASLINYVNAVDDLTVVEKCKAGVDSYLDDLCTPDDDKYEYPYKCRLLSRRTLGDGITRYVEDYCKDPTMTDNEWENSSLQLQMSAYAESAIDDIVGAVQSELASVCEDLDGHWYNTGCNSSDEKHSQFYNTVFGRGSNYTQSDSWGCCYANSERIVCESYNEGRDSDSLLTEWDAVREECIFNDAWYQMKCDDLDGYYENGTCYVSDNG